MAEYNIYKDISERTGGDVYIGVVGPVRTGKSTFIKKFMENLVLPNMEDSSARERARDEMPQSAQGKTVMTTEPKFVPDEAVNISVDGSVSMRVKMIDCVGYIVPGAIGHVEDGKPRMVMTPWAPEEIPFEKAAEIGTQKVINEHSTIGCLVTCDGTIGDLSRESYVETEKRVVNELKAVGKPFVIILNSANPGSEEAIRLALSLEEEYKVHVALVNCLEIDAEDIKNILALVLLEFPIREIKVELPGWIEALDDTHLLKKCIYESVLSRAQNIKTVGEAKDAYESEIENPYGFETAVAAIDLATGKLTLNINVPEQEFFSVLGEQTGFEVDSKEDLVKIMSELSSVKKDYDKLSDALRQVNETGYGIVTPAIDELKLEEPEIVKQPGGYGVRLRASAPSIHMIKADIKTEVSPIVGSEKQSDEMVKFLLKEFEEDPKKIWESNMFGKSLHELINEGLNAKLSHMPHDARMKLADTLQKIINDGSNGLICIIL
ncbi:MAG: stage IV sporulation protein A [Ruminococcaceae bacterium]|nr:stage IV sporulation protein A [Oscillospiraceae bacterium]